MSNSFVTFSIHVGMVFSLVMSRSHLSICFMYSWSNSFHSSRSIGSGFPNFSTNYSLFGLDASGCERYGDFYVEVDSCFINTHEYINNYIKKKIFNK